MMPDLAPERLVELRHIAEAATPGPWEVVGLAGYGGPYALRMPHRSRRTWYGVEGIKRREDAEYIATFDPPTVLALLDENERLQQKVQRANALAVAVEQVLKAWSMGDYLTPFMYDLGNALLDFDGPVASEDGWLEVATDGEEGGASDA